MKLKEAKLIAKEKGCKWIAVNGKYCRIFGFHNKPNIYPLEQTWLDTDEEYNDIYIGDYTGSKLWTWTLRKVK